MGRPCLASDVGGHKELIIDQKDGLLFKAGDIDSLISQLKLAYQQNDFGSIIKNGLHKVNVERNWTVSAAPYQSIYTMLMNNTASGNKTHHINP